MALAGAGTLAKSMAKGMGRPCFRVIQTHFSGERVVGTGGTLPRFLPAAHALAHACSRTPHAATNNVGDVAAKEEVWEVAAQLAGLAASVALLQLIESAGRPELAVPAWAAVHSVHVALRYVALASLRFPWPNQKRAAAMVARHVSTGSVPSIEEANAGEALLASPSSCRPRVRFGCSLEEALGGTSFGSSGSSSSNGNGNGSSPGSSGGGSHAEQLQQLVALYRGERYLLTWRDGTAHVLLQEEAAPLDLVRAMWQAAWLDSQQQAQVPGGSSNGSSSSSDDSGGLEQLSASLEALRGAWPGFVAAAEAQGWQLDKAVLPRGQTLVRLE